MQQAAHSPYEVPVMSVVTLNHAPDAKLQPFEQDQLKRLIQQVVAAPPRVRAAFLVSLNGLSL